jgi:hypothetical protein
MEAVDTLIEPLPVEPIDPDVVAVSPFISPFPGSLVVKSRQYFPKDPSLCALTVTVQIKRRVLLGFSSYRRILICSRKD